MTLHPCEPSVCVADVSPTSLAPYIHSPYESGHPKKTPPTHDAKTPFPPKTRFTISHSHARKKVRTAKIPRTRALSNHPCAHPPPPVSHANCESRTPLVSRATAQRARPQSRCACCEQRVTLVHHTLTLCAPDTIHAACCLSIGLRCVSCVQGVLCFRLRHANGYLLRGFSPLLEPTSSL